LGKNRVEIKFMSINFSQAELTDREKLLELMREYYAFDNLRFDEAAAREALKQILQDESVGRIWLIKLDDEIAGYSILTLGFSLEFHGRDAFLDEIYLRDRFRGRGIGRRALEFLEEQCRQLGVRALHLEVERENKNAQAVYRGSGFTDHDRYLMTKWIKQAE
jgi:diamine N-acetyltransferase